MPLISLSKAMILDSVANETNYGHVFSQLVGVNMTKLDHGDHQNGQTSSRGLPIPFDVRNALEGNHKQLKQRKLLNLIFC